jgi:hypothetical protein
MTNNLETHASESNKQASLYYKIVLFRWVSTTLIFYMIIPFSAIISYGEHGLLKRIYLQFQSDIIVGNAIPLLDPVSPEDCRYLVLFKMRFAFLTNPFNIIFVALLVFLPLDGALSASFLGSKGEITGFDEHLVSRISIRASRALH